MVKQFDSLNVFLSQNSENLPMLKFDTALIKPIERERDYAKRVFYLSDYAKEIRMSKIHEVIYQRFVIANEKLCCIWDKYGKKRFAISAVANVAMDVFGILGMYAYLAYGAMVTHTVSLGDFGALLQSAGRFSHRLRQVLIVTMDFAEKCMYVDKFRNFMEYQPKIEL